MPVKPRSPLPSALPYGEVDEGDFQESVRRQKSRLVIDGWTQENVPISQINVELTRAVGRFRSTRSGFVIGLVIHATVARTAGTLTIKVFKNTGLAGAAGAQLGVLVAKLDATNTSKHAVIQRSASDFFSARDELYLTVTTDASWAPTTSDIRCALEIEI